MLAPENHAEFSAWVMRPYVSEANHWLVFQHGVVQGHFLWDKIGQVRNARERFRGHPHFGRTALFCERWDQTSFETGYDTLPLDAFEPMVRRIFSREPWSETGVGVALGPFHGGGTRFEWRCVEVGSLT